MLLSLSLRLPVAYHKNHLETSDHVVILFWGGGQGCTSNFCDCTWTGRLNCGVYFDCLLVLTLLAVLK